MPADAVIVQPSAHNRGEDDWPCQHDSTQLAVQDCCLGDADDRAADRALSRQCTDVGVDSRRRPHRPEPDCEADGGGDDPRDRRWTGAAHAEPLGEPEDGTGDRAAGDRRSGTVDSADDLGDEAAAGKPRKVGIQRRAIFGQLRVG